MPLLIIAIFSFSETRIAAFPLGDFTLQWYREMFTDGEIGNAVVTTLICSAGALIGTALFGIPLAFASYRRNFPGKKLMSRAMYLPVVLPGLVNGFVVLAWITMLRLPLGIWAVVLTYTTVIGAIVFSMVYARLLRMDPRMEEAALDLGATPREAMRYVTLPLLRPTLIGAALTVMMLTFEDLLAIFFLIGDGYNIQMLVWSRLRVELTPELHALATVIFVFSAIVVIFLTAVLEREKEQLR
jgi:spermidine/putrescine transport system permease protein